MAEAPTGWLRTVRAGVKATLTSDSDAWHAWDYNPEHLAAPAIAITYGEPLLEDGPEPTFGTAQVRLVVTLIPELADNESVTDALDRFIQTSVVRLLEAGYGVERVGKPYVFEANNGRFLAVDVTVTTDVQPQVEGD